MDVDKEYFSNITTRERAIFEGAISMGALFHQFVGTPVNKNTKKKPRDKYGRISEITTSN